MKEQIKVWGSRVLVLAVLAFVVQHWGLPAYKRYMKPKKTTAYIPTGEVQEGPFTVSFHEAGTLEAEKSVPVISEINGKIIYLVDAGTVVSEGGKIAELDTADIEREVRNQKLNYENVKAEVDKAKTDFNIFKEQNKTELLQQEKEFSFNENELKIAQADLEKKRKLAAEKLIPGTQVDQAEAVVRSKELAVEKGKLQLELKKKEIEAKEKQKEADVRNVEFRAQMAMLQLQDVERRMSKAVITAPASGMVVIAKGWTPNGRQPLKAGDNVNPMQMICELPDLSSMCVKVQLGEADAPKVSIGMETLIQLQAVPNRLFHGTVTNVASLATEPMPWETGAGRKNIEIKVAIKEVEPQVLKPGMTADVEFIQDSLSSAVYVPIESIVETGGKTYVYVKQGKKYHKVEVELGRSNDNYVVVEKGVVKGETVALRDPTRAMEDQAGDTWSKGDEDEKEKEKTSVPIPGQD